MLAYSICRVSICYACREWFEVLKTEADLRLIRQSSPDDSGAAEPVSYSVHLKPGPIEIHPVQYAALTR